MVYCYYAITLQPTQCRVYVCPVHGDLLQAYVQLSSGINGAHHYSGFKFKVVALSFLVYDIPSIAVFFCKICFVFSCCYLHIHWTSLVSILVAPVITGTIKLFMFHIR